MLCKGHGLWSQKYQSYNTGILLHISLETLLLFFFVLSEYHLPYLLNGKVVFLGEASRQSSFHEWPFSLLSKIIEFIGCLFPYRSNLNSQWLMYLFFKLSNKIPEPQYWKDV